MKKLSTILNLTLLFLSACVQQPTEQSNIQTKKKDGKKKSVFRWIRSV
jgi:hypothetical protein